MKQKHLESALSRLNGFSEPKVFFEQYPTPPRLASSILLKILNDYHDIDDQSVLDLGCGAGMLSIGSDLCGASSVIGVDIDPDALSIAKSNVEMLELSNDFDFVQSDVCFNQSSSNWLFPESCVDCVISNPPFGTRGRGQPRTTTDDDETADTSSSSFGSDMSFLSRALYLSSSSVYFFFKTASRSFIRDHYASLSRREWTMEVVAETDFCIPKLYKFHKQKSVVIQVDCIRFVNNV